MWLDRRKLSQHIINILGRGAKRYLSIRSPESDHRFNFVEMPGEASAKRHCTLEFFRSFQGFRLTLYGFDCYDERIESNQHTPLFLPRVLLYFQASGFCRRLPVHKPSAIGTHCVANGVE